MQKLPQTFKKYGYSLKLVQRGQKKAIYRQSIGNHLFAYEVIKIRLHPARYNAFFKRNESEPDIYPISEQ